ncbi:MAG: sigma-54-dependent Fis family transcriptional regulator [Xanthomonadaceae bacterium]|nr:sigma-54-dependent Fis family transcriptional regulator [Xanthomonadaceae bacterium]
MNNIPQILIADDDSIIHMSMDVIAEKQGWKLTHTSLPKQTLEKVNNEIFDLIILDIHFGHKKAGLEVLKSLQKSSPLTPVIMLSGENEFSFIKEALKLGAEDYIIKGDEEEKLVHSIGQVLKTKKLSDQSLAHSRELIHRDEAHQLVGETVVVQELRKTIDKLRNKRINILIYGETGTGKEIVARGLRARSGDELEPFVAIDSATILSSTAESSLFGHEKGAFTGAEQSKTGLFEEARDGTIYFDEVSNMPLEIQSKLMRVLQEKEIRKLGSNQTIKLDFRVIAATNKDLTELSKKGEFKDDLFQRLNVVPITIPPLRDRANDVPLLISRAFLKAGSPQFNISEDAITLLKVYPWPGNVRELVHLVHYWIAMNDTGSIEVPDLPPHIRIAAQKKGFSSSNNQSQSNEQTRSDKSGTFYDKVEAYESSLLKEEYKICDGNISALAEKMGMDRSHLYSKLAQYGIHQKREKNKPHSL